jgi:hypothetical protein
MMLAVTTRMAAAAGREAITYYGVAAFRVGPDGALRLYERRWRLFLRQRAYHPAGEWVAVRDLEAQVPA